MAENISKEVRNRVRLKYNNHCAYCGCNLSGCFTVDHIDPKRRHNPPNMRGTDKEYNLNPCCISCNSSKSTFSIEQWRCELELKYDRLIRDSSQFRILNRFGFIKKQNKIVFYFEKL